MSNTRASIGSTQLQHRFFVATAGVLLAIVLIGFSPNFFLKFVFEQPGLIARTAEDLGSSGDGGWCDTWVRRGPCGQAYRVRSAACGRGGWSSFITVVGQDTAKR